MTDFDVVTMGRIGIDLYAEQRGVGLADVTSFARFLGGSPTNVAVGTRGLGHPTAIVTRVGDDAFGDFAVQALAGYGVATEWVGRESGRRTPVAFAEIRPPDSFPLTFYRDPDAPDTRIAPGDVDLDLIEGAGILWVTGGSLATEPSRSAVVAALRARAGKPTVLDLDYRPSLWSAESDVRQAITDILEFVTVVVGNEQEFAVATGLEDSRAGARSMIDRGVGLSVLKRGPRGVWAISADGSSAEAPAFEVEVVCGLGAGDAFGASLCHGLLENWPLDRMLAFSSAAGAIVTGRLACSDAMPTIDDVEAFLREKAAIAGESSPE